MLTTSQLGRFAVTTYCLSSVSVVNKAGEKTWRPSVGRFFCP